MARNATRYSIQWKKRDGQFEGLNSVPRLTEAKQRAAATSLNNRNREIYICRMGRVDSRRPSLWLVRGHDITVIE